MDLLAPPLSVYFSNDEPFCTVTQCVLNIYIMFTTVFMVSEDFNAWPGTNNSTGEPRATLPSPITAVWEMPIRLVLCLYTKVSNNLWLQLEDIAPSEIIGTYEQMEKDRKNRKIHIHSRKPCHAGKQEGLDSFAIHSGGMCLSYWSAWFNTERKGKVSYYTRQFSTSKNTEAFIGGSRGACPARAPP